jgi:hypothetical protein
MAQDRPELLLERFAPEGSVQRLAADDAVVISVRTAIRRRDEMFDARFTRRNRCITEEASLPL